VQAITVIPGRPGSAELSEVPDPRPGPGDLLVETIALGVCGTDREIVAGEHGEAPPGGDRLVLGHELLGRVRDAPPGSGVEPGDLAAGIVRRPDPEPCACCARGEWDMCRNGRYTERGIKGLDGYGAELVALEVEAPPLPRDDGRAYMRAKAGRAEAARLVHDPLACLARDSVVRSGPELLRSGYLVERDTLDSFVSMVGRLQQAHSGLDILCTGPWPPYSFCER
jgi:threonine dehydrogenase-like Zn-dependent dehydrogenase